MQKAAIGGHPWEDVMLIVRLDANCVLLLWKVCIKERSLKEEEGIQIGLDAGGWGWK